MGAGVVRVGVRVRDGLMGTKISHAGHEDPGPQAAPPPQEVAHISYRQG